MVIIENKLAYCVSHTAKINNLVNISVRLSNSALIFLLFVNFISCGNKAQVLVVRGFFERPLANVGAVWWEMLDAV